MEDFGVFVPLDFRVIVLFALLFLLGKVAVTIDIRLLLFLVFRTSSEAKGSRETAKKEDKAK